jgi:hypothetical protein
MMGLDLTPNHVAGLWIGEDVEEIRYTVFIQTTLAIFAKEKLHPRVKKSTWGEASELHRLFRMAKTRPWKFVDFVNFHDIHDV